jgi:predicted Zn-dependent protease with MMP-like domain
VKESLWPVIRAGGIAAFAVGVLIMLVNPPSLSGLPELLAYAGGALGLALLAAWTTVTLAGQRSMSEGDFEQVVRRSEAMAERADAPVGAETEFELLVAEAVDRLPEEFRRLVEDTPVVVSRRGAEAGAYGHYFGDTVARDDHEDRIIIYEDTLERDFGWDRDLLAAQVERTLRHEIAHHLGWGEPGVRDLGL